MGPSLVPKVTSATRHTAGSSGTSSAADRARAWVVFRGSTPAEGRAESVAEAGGTGAAVVATPTTPPAGHAADSPANRRPRPAGIGDRRENIRRLAAGNVRPSGRPGGLPNRERRPERRFFGGIEGGRQHPSPAATLNVACAGLPTLTVESQPSAEPPKPPLRARSGVASTGPSRASCSASRSPSSRTARTTGDPRHLPKR